MCWFPLRPWRLRISGDDYEHIVRCGECPGCLEFDRRRLADRLNSRYAHLAASSRQKLEISSQRSTATSAGCAKRLYLVRIYAPLQSHAALSHSLHRRRALQLEPGFFRLGVGSFAVLTTDPRRVRTLLRGQRREHRIEPIRFSRGRRAWRAVTAGLMVAREAYGEQVKRWYARGLPAAERKKWTVLKHAFGKGYQRTESPRAWSSRRVVLVPPEVWKLRAADRADVRRLLSRTPNPEGVGRVMALVNQVISRSRPDSTVMAAPAGRSDRARMVESARIVAKQEATRTETAGSESDRTPPPGGGGYVSSGHSSTDESRSSVDQHAPPTTIELRKARAKKEIAEILERLRKKIGGGK